VENPAVPSSGVLAWQPSCEGYHRDCFHPGMNRCRCQSPPGGCGGGSRGSASPAASLSRPRDARGCSGSARTATAGSAIAARVVAPKLAAGNAALPTVATNRVQKAGSIIATGNVPTGSVTRRLSWRIKVPSRSVLRHHSAVEKRVAMPVALRRPATLSCGPEQRADLWLCCAICGRPGRFVDPFPRIPRRR
jgi:hypothetical protein